jgi:8-oxo-dGTP pyrophosphatase MutT (NUDIX family)
MQPPGFDPGQNGALTEAEIARRLSLPPALPADQGPDFSRLALRPAAVLVPLIWVDEEWQLVFTRRTETVQSHKGQVSFPGGAADPQDDSPEATALREAFEEIGLLPEDVTLLGRLPYLATVTNYIITPVVGRIRWPFDFQPAVDEVSRVFTMPLGWLADPAHREVRPLPRVGYYEDVIYYQPYDGELLWGATARITVEFLRIINLTV